MQKYQFQNPELDIEERIDNLLSLLNKDEKLQLLNSGGNYIERLNITTAGQVEGYHGSALGAQWGGEHPIATTQFCQAIGLGETWDPEIVRQAAEAEAIEFRYAFHKLGAGGLVVRSPNADLGRDPRWGRTEECFGEDAYFNSVMVQAVIKGLEGDDPKYIRTASLLKHFLANSNEDTRTSSSSEFDDQLFREYYSYPFMKGFTEAGAKCYMTAYNKYNGIPCIIHPMIKDITIKEWGVDGIICTDGGALGLLVSDHHYFDNNKDASAACIKAGINQFLDDLYTAGVPEALKEGLIDMTDIDQALRGNLRTFMKLGLFDPPAMVPYTEVGEIEPWKSEKHKELAKKVTRKSIVLLKNENELLPLNVKKQQSIAVIGKLASEVLLDWYSGELPYSVTPLEGIKKKVGKYGSVIFAGDQKEDAIKAASQSDVAIVVLGNDPISGNLGWAITQMPSEGREAADRKTITLEQNDEELLHEVLKANPNTILVLVSSFPYAINKEQELIPSIVHMTHNSQEMGNALADVLFGDYNPAGRLVQTWPKSLEQVPDLMDYDIRHGRTYMYFKDKPLYYFGYGLSYTRFKYDNLVMSSESLNRNETLTIEVDVANVGNYPGEEVVQMYFEYIDSSVQRPQITLKGFKRIMIGVGCTETVTFRLNIKDTAYWNIEKSQWCVENGKIRISFRSSSAEEDVKLTCVVRVEDHQHIIS